MRKCELLSPAGDMDSLVSAINGGCDAVYVGMQKFGARKFAKNFSREEFLEAVKKCHLYGVRLYVTMNTLVKDSEVSEFIDLVDFLHKNGVDAIIMQDFGMICLVREIFPNLEIHASTQCNSNYKETIELFKKLGVSRIVVPREMSIDEINSIDTDIEIEAFIHGALCISYSGLCLMSSLLGGRSGNRGECTGCCRLFYELFSDNKLIKDGYLLSTKELNTSNHVRELLDSNIYSFKIEGRMKSSEYVYFITKYYRSLIDNNFNIDKNNEILKVLYNRKFTDGNLFSNKNIMNNVSVNHQGLCIGKVLSVTDEKIKLYIDKTLHQEDGIRFNNSNKGMIVNFLYDSKMKLTSKTTGICYVPNKIGLVDKDIVSVTSSKVLNNYINSYEKRKVSISMKFVGKANEDMVLTVSDGDNFVTVSGDTVQVAVKQPLSSDRISSQLKKTGDTIYDVCCCDVICDDNIFIPIVSINNIRREALLRLDEIRLSKICQYKRESVEFDKLDVVATDYNFYDAYDDFDMKKYSGADKFLVHKLDLFLKYKDENNIYYSVDCNNVNDRFDNECVSNYLYPRGNSISDYSFNVFNSYTVYYLHKLGYSCVSLSVELSTVEIQNLIDEFYKNFKFYPNVLVWTLGRVRQMLIKGNILNIDCNKTYYLKNSGRMFPVLFDGKFTSIYSSSIIDRIDFVRDVHYKINRRYDFKFFSEEEFDKFNIIN